MSAEQVDPKLDRPKFIEADHVSWSVPDLEAAVEFYKNVFGAKELFRLGPLDSRDIPRYEDGKDWTEAHINVPDARITLVMMSLLPNLNFQLIHYERPASATQHPPRNNDRGGHHLGIKVDDVEKAARYLTAHGCKVMKIIEINDGPLAGKKNMYVVDPWGHHLEIVD